MGARERVCVCARARACARVLPSADTKVFSRSASTHMKESLTVPPLCLPLDAVCDNANGVRVCMCVCVCVCCVCVRVCLRQWERRSLTITDEIKISLAVRSRCRRRLRSAHGLGRMGRGT